MKITNYYWSTRNGPFTAPNARNGPFTAPNARNGPFLALGGGRA